jgi:hypothetical protein
MTTDTFYAAATGNQTDGFVYSKDATYSDILGTAGTEALASESYIGQGYWSSYFRNYEYFAGWNTSTIDDGVTLSTAAISLYGAFAVAQSGITIYGAIYDFTSGDTNGLTAADYRTQAHVAAFSPLVSFDAGSWAADYNTFTDIALPANVNKTGWTLTTFWSSQFESGTEPSGDKTVAVLSAQTDGTSQDPKLIVTYGTTFVPGIMQTRFIPSFLGV